MYSFFAALLLLPAALRAQEIHVATYNVQQPSDAQSTPESTSTQDSQDYRSLYPYPPLSTGYSDSNTSTYTPYSSSPDDCSTPSSGYIYTNPTSVIYSVTGTGTGTGYVPTGSGVPGNQTNGTTYYPPTLTATVVSTGGPSGTPAPPASSTRPGEPLFSGAAGNVRVEGWLLSALFGALIMGL